MANKVKYNLGFNSALMYLIIFNKEKSVENFAFSFGCFACLIGLKAFDCNDNTRGEIFFTLNKLK